MFEITAIPMEIEAGEGVTKVIVHPEDLYPAMVARVFEVLGGANPTEILALPERGGVERANRLMANARGLPVQAWEDALRPREEFCELPYGAFVERNGGVKVQMLEALAKGKRAEVERMVQRGFALEIAMGWFLHALRLALGAVDVTITTGRDGLKAFRL